jgi:hypothetical protein
VGTQHLDFADFYRGSRDNCPEEQIIGRGRSVRAWRRLPGLAAGALAAAGAAALTVAALLPAGPASHHGGPAGHPGIRLASWTVAKRADGSIEVTIREMRDPAGLQRRLRAVGVPAAVTFFSGPVPQCRPFTERAVDPAHPRERIRVINPGLGVIRFPRHLSLPVVLLIRPAALPPRAGLEIVSGYEPGMPANRHVQPAIGSALVHLSPRCTGG